MKEPTSHVKEQIDLAGDLFTPLSFEEKLACSAQYTPTEYSKKPIWRLALEHKSILVASLLLLFILSVALFGPLLSPYSFEETTLANKNLPPSLSHIFGTDDLGRDLFTRVCHGLRVSLFVGLLAAGIDLLIGVSWGVTAGFIGGWADQVMMRAAEMIYGFPYLIFVILVSSILGPGFTSIIAAMVMIGWIQMARISRQLVIQITKSEYVTAAISLGASPFGIVRRHILPNITGPIVAVVMLTIPQAIFVEAFLSFLGIGIQPPVASLGSLVSDAMGSMRYYPWKLFIPASTITLSIFAFNLLGDGIRDLLDPQTRLYLKQANK